MGADKELGEPPREALLMLNMEMRAAMAAAQDDTALRTGTDTARKRELAVFATLLDAGRNLLTAPLQPGPRAP